MKKILANGIDVTNCELLVRTDTKKPLCGLGGECDLYEFCSYKSAARTSKENLDYIKLYNAQVKENERLRKQNTELIEKLNRLTTTANCYC